MEEGGQLGRKNYPFSHGVFYFNDKKDINMERLWPISGILKFDLNPQSTILCSQMLEVIFVYAPTCPGFDADFLSFFFSCHKIIKHTARTLR